MHIIQIKTQVSKCFARNEYCTYQTSIFVRVIVALPLCAPHASGIIICQNVVTHAVVVLMRGRWLEICNSTRPGWARVRASSGHRDYISAPRKLPPDRYCCCVIVVPIARPERHPTRWMRIEPIGTGSQPDVGLAAGACLIVYPAANANAPDSQWRSQRTSTPSQIIICMQQPKNNSISLETNTVSPFTFMDKI